jgi:hypothetical protein
MKHFRNSYTKACLHVSFRKYRPADNFVHRNILSFLLNNHSTNVPYSSAIRAAVIGPFRLQYNRTRLTLLLSVNKLIFQVHTQVFDVATITLISIN